MGMHALTREEVDEMPESLFFEFFAISPAIQQFAEEAMEMILKNEPPLGSRVVFDMDDHRYLGIDTVEYARSVHDFEQDPDDMENLQVHDSVQCGLNALMGENIGGMPQAIWIFHISLVFDPEGVPDGEDPEAFIKKIYEDPDFLDRDDLVRLPYLKPQLQILRTAPDESLGIWMLSAATGHVESVAMVKTGHRYYDSLRWSNLVTPNPHREVNATYEFLNEAD